MPDFSYQSDVAPYASTLFKRAQSNPFLSSARSAELSNSLLDTVEAARKRGTEIEKDSLATELARTRLATDRLALDDAREELQQKREAIAKAPQADAAFESILNDDSLDQRSKKAAVARWGMQHADSIVRSPVLAAKFRFASAAADPDEKSGITPSLAYRMGRDAKIDERYATKDAKDAAEKAAKEEKDKQESFSKELGSVLDGAAVVDTDEMTGAKITPKFKNPLDRIRILNLLPVETETELDELDKLSDIDLFRHATLKKRKLSLPSSTTSPHNTAADKVRSLFPNLR